jgi:multidrug efflux pump subunit AcrA (membrane-fusion protein)
VQIALRRPQDVRGLDGAPVEVEITTGRVADALSVPVTALVAQAGGGYAVERQQAGRPRELVPVKLGMFDQGDGIVEITGAGIRAGQRVVIPSS